jgi:chromosome partitioning protein
MESLKVHPSWSTPAIGVLSREAHVVAVCNLKGGTGKSTLSINLACALAELGERVILVDNDEQGSAAGWAQGGTLPMRCVHLPLPRAEEFARWLRTFLGLRAEADILYRLT